MNGARLEPPFPPGLQRAIFGMGCFWGAEKKFWQLPGVYTTAVGYAGGFTPNPDLPGSLQRETGHAEVVLVVFDPGKISYADLLQVFWESHDPTQGMRQGNDVGTQYRSAIYYTTSRSATRRSVRRDAFQQELAKAGYGAITTEIQPAPSSITPRIITSNIWPRTRRVLRPGRHRRVLPGRSRGLMPAPALLVGTHTFAAQVEAERRQAAGVSSLAALSGVEVVNLQFESDPHHIAGVETLASLCASSLTVTGRKGVRKPIMSEMFEVLAATAEARGIGWFCFTNADIIFSQAAIEWILGVPGEAAVLSREDFDPTGREAAKMELAGTDAFAIETRWWKSHRHLFRGYIAGDGGWDNVYTAVLLCHARGVIENRRPLIRHERHRRGPMISAPFGEVHASARRARRAVFQPVVPLLGRVDPPARLRRKRRGGEGPGALGVRVATIRPRPRGSVRTRCPGQASIRGVEANEPFAPHHRWRRIIERGYFSALLAFHPARPHAPQPHRRIADVPVLQR